MVTEANRSQGEAKMPVHMTFANGTNGPVETHPLESSVMDRLSTVGSAAWAFGDEFQRALHAGYTGQTGRVYHPPAGRVWHQDTPMWCTEYDDHTGRVYLPPDGRVRHEDTPMYDDQQRHLHGQHRHFDAQGVNQSQQVTIAQHLLTVRIVIPKHSSDVGAFAGPDDGRLN